MLLGSVVFSNGPGRVSTGGIEIAQADAFEAVGTVEIGQHSFYGKLRVPVTTGWVFRVVFVDGDVLGFAEDGGGGAEDKFVDTIGKHDFQEVQNPCGVVLPVLGWVPLAFADGYVGGEVHDKVDGGVGFEAAFKGGGVSEIALKERAAGERLLVALFEVIEDDMVFSRLPQEGSHVGADVACSSNDEYHCVRILVWVYTWRVVYLRVAGGLVVCGILTLWRRLPCRRTVFIFEGARERPLNLPRRFARLGYCLRAVWGR